MEHEDDYYWRHDSNRFTQNATKWIERSLAHLDGNRRDRRGGTNEERHRSPQTRYKNRECV